MSVDAGWTGELELETIPPIFFIGGIAKSEAVDMIKVRNISTLEVQNLYAAEVRSPKFSSDNEVAAERKE